MVTTADKYKSLFLGIDGGGSKTKAIVVNENNEILGTGISGPGNPLHGFEQAIFSITEAAQLALKNAGLSHMKLIELNAGVGLAGVNLPILFNKMQAWQHPFKQLFLAHDLLIACLGAHGGQDGAVIVSGTGSCGFSFIDGKEMILGGYGIPQGDQGSGAWFGVEAIKTVLLSLDGIVQPSLMNSLILRKLDCVDTASLVETVAGKTATFYAQLANIVFDAAEQGDKLATKIVKEGAEYINSVAHALLKNKHIRIALLGGIASRLKPNLDTDIQIQLIEPIYAPEFGAVIFSRQALAKLNG